MSKRDRIRMAWADVDDKAFEYVNEVMQTGWFSRSKFIPRFESKVAELHGNKHGVMMNSGTDALRIALATLKEINRWEDGSEVLCPAVTFVATANVIFQNNLKPKFVDVEPSTYTLDTGLLSDAISKNTVAIIPVHLFGFPCDVKSILPIASHRRLKIIEDSCEAMFVHKIKGDIGCFSTYMAHMLQTGVGGVLTTDNPKIEKIARSYMNHGRDDNPNAFRFERIGYSSRVTELEAALGCAQILRWRQILKRRQAIAQRLTSALGGHYALQLPLMQPASSWMLYPLLLLKGSRDKLMAKLLEKGIESRQMMPLINQKPYRHFVKAGEFPVAERINETGFCLPCHQKLTDDEVDYMAAMLWELA